MRRRLPSGAPADGPGPIDARLPPSPGELRQSHGPGPSWTWGRLATRMHDPELWRVATFNIWNRQGPWDRRLPLIREGLAALDAAIIGLQEGLAFGTLPS